MLATGEPQRFEKEYIRKDGKRISVELLIHRNVAAADNIENVFGFVTDITDRKKAEEEKEILMHNMGERVKELQCLYSIAECIRLRETVKEIFMDILALIPPGWHYPDITRGKIRFEGKDYVTEPFEETEWRQTSDILIKGKRSGSVEVYYLEERPELDEGPFLSEERNLIDGIAQTLSEAIERNQAEEEAVRAAHLASIGELAAGVAHEINNPINGIINYASIIEKQSKQNDELKDIAHRIIKEGDRIANIVKSLLVFASNGSGDKKNVTVKSIIYESLNLTEKQLRNDGITLKVKMEEDLPPVYVNPLEIEQVFMNIINNARYALNQKYSSIDENKNLQIESNKVMINNRPYAEISIIDKGIGIPAHISDKIMNPFYSTKRQAIGTGLGLSISKGIIKNHGGELLIDSLEGNFTRVKIQLPLSKQKNNKNVARI